MKKLSIILLAIAMLSICSCSNNSQNAGNNNTIEYNPEEKVEINYADYGLDKDFVEQYEKIAIGDVGDMIQSFPSPVEMAALIQDMGVDYKQNYLSETSIADNFETNFKKALGLGVYCADLGYLNVYNKTGDVIAYLVTIKKLSDQLKIGQFFDFAVLKRLATNNNNLDSLLILSVQSYFSMDEYLRQNERSNLSALMVTGVWVESLYLAGEVYKEKPNKKMKDFIAGQKDILNNLMAILIKFMNNDADYVKLVANLKQLVEALKVVEIENVKGESSIDDINGHQVTTQGDYTIITVSDEQMQQIVKAIEDIREKITKQL